MNFAFLAYWQQGRSFPELFEKIEMLNTQRSGIYGSSWGTRAQKLFLSRFLLLAFLILSKYEYTDGNIVKCKHYSWQLDGWTWALGVKAEAVHGVEEY